MQNQTKDSFIYKVACAFICACFGFVFFQAFNFYVPSDAAWYLIATERLVNISSSSEVILDTNPPMSFWVYLPYHYFWQLTGLDRNLCVLFLTALIVLMNGAFVYVMLDKFAQTPLRLSATASYFFLALVVGIIFIGHKDYLIAQAFVPFSLALVYLSKYRDKYSIPFLALVINIPYVFVKPHFLLVVGVVFFCRLWQREPLVWHFFTRYVLFVFVCGVVYLGSIWVLWPDFYALIFHDSMNYYAGYVVFKEIYGYSVYYFLFTAIGIYFLRSKALVNNDYFLFVLSACLTSLFAYALQLKGFVSHSLPFFFALNFLVMPLVFSVLGSATSKYVSFKICITTVVFPLIAFFSVFDGFHNIYSYEKAIKIWRALGEEVQSYAQQGDSFYFESQYTGPGYWIALNYNMEHATRFPSMWLSLLVKTMPEEEKEAFIQKYSAMVREDWDRWSPEVIMLRNSDYYSEKSIGFMGDVQTLKSLFEERGVMDDVLEGYELVNDDYTYSKRSYSLYVKRDAD